MSSLTEFELEFGKGIVYIIIAGIVSLGALMRLFKNKQLSGIFHMVSYDTALALVVAYIAVELLSNTAVLIDNQINNDNQDESSEVTTINAGNILYSLVVGLGALIAIISLLFKSADSDSDMNFGKYLPVSSMFGKKRMRRKR